MNPFVVSPSFLNSEWKELRNKIAEMTRDEMLYAVSSFWSKAPVKKFAYDPEALDTVPSPWEMVAANDWCENSIAIGMEFTMRLAGIEPERMKLLYIRDNDLSMLRLVLEVDGEKWLNYDFDTISPIPDTNYHVIDSWVFGRKNYVRSAE